MQVLFGARFRKLPSVIEAVRQEQPFSMPKPASWNQEGMLEGQAGDYRVKNLTTGEQYPLGPEVLAQKYDHLTGDRYESKPVILEGRLPRAGEDEIETREGLVETHIDGVPSVIMEDAGGTFPLAGKHFLKFYEAADEEARQIVEKLKALLVGQD